MQVRFKLLDSADSGVLEQALTSAAAAGEITIKPSAPGAGAGMAEVIVIALIGAGGAILAAAIGAYATYLAARINAGKAGTPPPSHLSINGTKGSELVALDLQKSKRDQAVKEAIDKVGVVTSVDVVR